MSWSQGYHDFWRRCETHDWWWRDKETLGEREEQALRTEAEADRKKEEIFQAWLQYEIYGADKPQKENYL